VPGILPGVKGDRRVKMTTPPPPESRLSYKMWEHGRVTILCIATACYRDNFTF
jgi:hypothetical protein